MRRIELIVIVERLRLGDSLRQIEFLCLGEPSRKDRASLSRKASCQDSMESHQTGVELIVVGELLRLGEPLRKPALLCLGDPSARMVWTVWRAIAQDRAHRSRGATLSRKPSRIMEFLCLGEPLRKDRAPSSRKVTLPG